MGKYSKIIMLFLIVHFYSCNKTKPLPENIDFKQEMRNFIQGISEYSKNINPGFVIVPQNGVELVSTTGDDNGSPELTYLNSIDGIGQEDLFFGYDKDDVKTPEKVTEWLRFFLDMAKAENVKILVTDYCSTHSNMDYSYSKNNESGYVSFAANHRELDNIPDYPDPIFNENSGVITSLDSVKNFLYLINPDNEFSSQEDFINSVKNTNYDLLITDLYFNGEKFSKSQIQELKEKGNGGKRLVICYMSIGEAENYRYYWHPDWKVGNPSFIDKENPDWPGNYKIRYWEKDWQNIIYGNDSSYLKKILDAGFDGIYLDIIDAFEYFE